MSLLCLNVKPYYLGDTGLRSELHPRRHSTGLCATTNQHCRVLYSQRRTAQRRALLPERHSTAQCATAREAQHGAVRHSEAPQQLCAHRSGMPSSLSFPDSGLHARGATPTARRPTMDFLHRPRKRGPSSRVNLPLRGGGTQGRKRHKSSRRDGQEFVAKI